MCEPDATIESSGGSLARTLSRTHSSTEDNMRSRGFEGALDDELGPIQSAPSFGATLSEYFELEDDLAEIDEVLLEAPRCANDQAVKSIMRNKFKAQMTVEKTAREVLVCERRLSDLCKLFNVTKEHCGIVGQRKNDIQSVFAAKFVESGRSLWPRWAQRQRQTIDHPTRTLDRIDTARCERIARDGVKHSWYFVAEFETDVKQVSRLLDPVCLRVQGQDGSE